MGLLNIDFSKPEIKTGLLATGINLLKNSNKGYSNSEALGRGLEAGLLGYNASNQLQRHNEWQDQQRNWIERQQKWKIQDRMMQQQQRELARLRELKTQRILNGFQDQDPSLNRNQRLTNVANQLMAAGQIDQASSILDMRDKGESFDLGGQRGFINPYSGNTYGMRQVTMNPAQRDSSARGWAGHNLQKQRFDYRKEQDDLMNKHTQVIVNPDGSKTVIKSTSPKPLSDKSLAMRSEAKQDILLIDKNNEEMEKIVNQIDTGKLDLSFINVKKYDLMNTVGMSDEHAQNYALAKAQIQKQINESLRLNKGVQTEGDAQRAANEIMQNWHNPTIVIDALRRLMSYNEVARKAKQQTIDDINNNYNQPLTYQNSNNLTTVPTSNQQQNNSGFSFVE